MYDKMKREERSKKEWEHSLRATDRLHDKDTWNSIKNVEQLHKEKGEAPGTIME